MTTLERERQPDANGLDWLSRWEAFEFKADGDEAGTIEGYASIFGEVDSGNDRVKKGAFAKSLAQRRSTRIPMFFGHAHSSVPIGVWTEIKEDGKGLKVKGRLLFETQDAKQVYAVLRAGGEMGISIGYRTIERRFITADGKEHADWQSNAIRELREVELREISLTAMPMLDSARVTKVKSDAQSTQEDAQQQALIRALRTGADALHLKHALRRATDRLRALGEKNG